jgi:hypothetical protein
MPHRSAGVNRTVFRPICELSFRRQCRARREAARRRKTGSSYIFMDSRDFTTRFARGTSEGFRGRGIVNGRA